MARTIYTLNKALTDAQITALYEIAEKFKVGISLYGNTPSATRDSFTWKVEGGIFRVVRMVRHLKAMR